MSASSPSITSPKASPAKPPKSIGRRLKRTVRLAVNTAGQTDYAGIAAQTGEQAATTAVQACHHARRNVERSSGFSLSCNYSPDERIMAPAICGMGWACVLVVQAARKHVTRRRAKSAEMALYTFSESLVDEDWDLVGEEEGEEAWNLSGAKGRESVGLGSTDRVVPAEDPEVIVNTTGHQASKKVRVPVPAIESPAIEIQLGALALGNPRPYATPECDRGPSEASVSTCDFSGSNIEELAEVLDSLLDSELVKEDSALVGTSWCSQ